jgi:hypothetical protein
VRWSSRWVCLLLGVDDGRLLVLLPGAISVDDGGATVCWFLVLMVLV